jgi:hypothetical protein
LVTFQGQANGNINLIKRLIKIKIGYCGYW